MASNKTDERPSGTTNSGETSFSDEILKLAQCLMPVAPTAKVRQVIESAQAETKLVEEKLGEVAWKAYDSVVGLVKQTTDQMLSNAGVGTVLGSSIDMMLRWQRFNTAVAGAFFSALWPAVGLPSGSEVTAVRADIRGLREELRAAVIEAETNEDYARELHQAVRHSIVNENEVENRRAGSQQIAIWTGWTGAERTEISDNVGN